MCSKLKLCIYQLETEKNQKSKPQLPILKIIYKQYNITTNFDKDKKQL